MKGRGRDGRGGRRGRLDAAWLGYLVSVAYHGRSPLEANCLTSKAKQLIE